MNPGIRLAEVEDIQGISDLIRDASPDGVGLEGTAEELRIWQEANCSLTVIADRLVKLSVATFVYETQEYDLVETGFARVESDGSGYIGGVYCSLRGHGVGSQILETLVAWLSKNGVTDIRMSVSAKNKPMLSLVRKFGFTVAGEEQGEYFRNGYWLILKN